MSFFKSFVVTGTPVEGYLTVNLQDTKLFTGKWFMCVKTITISEVDINDLRKAISISSNAIIGTRIKNYQHQTYNPPLNIFLLKNSNFDVHFELTWSEINNATSDIKFYFTDLERDELLKSNTKISVHVLLKQT